jgi:hypothetical protein
MDKLYYVDAALFAEVTGTNTHSKYDVLAVVDERPGYVWWSADISESTITFTYTTATLVELVHLINHNFETGDTVLFETSNDGFATPPLQSIPIDPAVSFLEMQFRNTHYRLKMQKTQGENSQVGKIFLAQKKFQPTPYSYSFTSGQEIKFPEKTAKGGHTYRGDMEYARKVITPPYKDLTKEEARTFEEIAKKKNICYYHYIDNKMYYGTWKQSTPDCTGVNEWKVDGVFTENGVPL